jgi:hypothetical protein
MPGTTQWKTPNRRFGRTSSGGGRAALASEPQQARRVHLDDHGLYMLIEAGGNCVVRGSLVEDIEGFLGGQEKTVAKRQREAAARGLPHVGRKIEDAGQAGQFDLVAGKVVASPLTLMLLERRTVRPHRPKADAMATNSTIPAIQNL